LHGQTNDDRSNSERGERAVPIDENYRNDNDCDQDSTDEKKNSPKCVTSDGIFNSPDRIHPDCFRSREDDNNKGKAPDKSPAQIHLRLNKRKKFGADEIVKNSATDE